MTANSISETQSWFRALGRRVASSYEGSAPLKHKVTKGRAREQQVVDVLRVTLPGRVEVATDVTITSMRDGQSPSFDAALLDRETWPRLYHDIGVEVAMVESVVAALEVKSVLDAVALADVFAKSGALRAMYRDPRTLHPGPPPVAAFAYRCRSLWLTFFDAMVLYAKAPEKAPSAIAVLNVGVFTLLRPTENLNLSVDQPGAGTDFVFMPTGEDTLLFFVYLLSRWGVLGSPMDQVFRAYSADWFGSLKVTTFDGRLVEALRSDASRVALARKCFMRSATTSFDVAQERALRAIGL